MSPSPRKRRPSRADVLRLAAVVIFFAAAPTAGDIGGCGQAENDLDPVKFFTAKQSVDCDRCQACAIPSNACKRACDPGLLFTDFAPGCVPLEHDGEVCVDALAAAGAATTGATWPMRARRSPPSATSARPSSTPASPTRRPSESEGCSSNDRPRGRGLRRGGFVTSPADYAAYRATRVAPTLEARLAAAERYLASYPEGAFEPDVRAAFERAEPVFFAAKEGPIAGMKDYLRALPGGPHHAQAEKQLGRLEALRDRRDLAVAEDVTAGVDRATAERAAVRAEFEAWIGRFLDASLWDAPLSRAKASLIVPWGLALPAPTCAPLEPGATAREGEGCRRRGARHGAAPSSSSSRTRSSWRGAARRARRHWRSRCSRTPRAGRSRRGSAGRISSCGWRRPSRSARCPGRARAADRGDGARGGDRAARARRGRPGGEPVQAASGGADLPRPGLRRTPCLGEDGCRGGEDDLILIRADR